MTTTKFIVLVALSGFFLTSGPNPASGQETEKITYEIFPVGISVYEDMGMVDFRGKKVNLITFSTQVTGFKDTEKIYSDGKTCLPLWVERDLLMWMHKEYLTEEYVSAENRLSITKYNGGKQVDEYLFKANGPICNAVLLPFSLRKVSDLKIGWSTVIRVPQEFKVELVSVDDVQVPAGKFKAYHFTSTPNKFEIWITADDLRIPVKIKGCGGLPYTLAMKERVIQQKGE
jgi:hypothetical protein